MEEVKRMSELCKSCHQPLPLTILGLSVSVERRRVTFPDGKMLRLGPRETQFLQAVITRKELTPNEMVVVFFGERKRRPKNYGICVRVVACALRRKFKPFGYTIAPSIYALQRKGK